MNQRLKHRSLIAARQKGSRMAGLHLSDEGVFLVSLPGRCTVHLKEQLHLSLDTFL